MEAQRLGLRAWDPLVGALVGAPLALRAVAVVLLLPVVRAVAVVPTAQSRNKFLSFAKRSPLSLLCLKAGKSYKSVLNGITDITWTPKRV